MSADETMRLPFSRRSHPIVVAFRVTKDELDRIDAAAKSEWDAKHHGPYDSPRGIRGDFIRRLVLRNLVLTLSTAAGKPAASGDAAAAGKPASRERPSRAGKPRSSAVNVNGAGAVNRPRRKRGS